MGSRVLIVDDSATIRKLVGSILARHAYDSAMAPDGQSGLDRLREGGFDLVLLDFVMPRMNGYQFCQELRSDDRLKEVPVVLMSAKGDKIRGQFVQQTGALDAITKPFDERGLIAVVESALQKASSGRTRGSSHPPQLTIPRDVESGPHVVPAVRRPPRPTGTGERKGSMPPSQPPGSEKEADAPKRAILHAAPVHETPAGPQAELAKALANLLAGRLGELPKESRSKPSPSDLLPIIERVLASPGAGALAAFDVPPPTPGDDKAVLAGDLAVIPLAEILQVLQLQKQTGICRVTEGKVEVLIFIRDGLVDLAQGRGASNEFRLGRYLIEEGLVTRDELSTILKGRLGAKRLLGDALVRFGLITDDDLRRALIRQTSELIYEVLRWPGGRFTFARSTFTPEAEAAHLGLPVASIVMEGFRRVDEWRLIEESIHFDEVLLRDQVALDALGEQKLTRQEQLVLEAIDGQRPVREIVAQVDVSSFDACKILYQFLQSRLVRRRAA